MMLNIINLVTAVKHLTNGHARDPAALLSFVERLSYFGGYIVWSVYTREPFVLNFIKYFTDIVAASFTSNI